MVLLYLNLIDIALLTLSSQFFIALITLGNFPNSFNFGISGDHTENAFWSALNLPDMLYLQKIVILCGTDNICNDFLYDIAQCLTDTGVSLFCFFVSLG